MGLLDFFRKKPSNSQTQGQTLQRIWSQAPKRETVSLPNMYHQSPALDPVDLIARNIADAPICLYSKKDERQNEDRAKKILEHNFFDLMEEPSKMFQEIDYQSLMNVTVILTELLGEMFWIKFRVGSRVNELLPFLPAWCTKTPILSDPFFYFNPFNTTSGKMWKVSPEDVVWFKIPDMTDPYSRGRGRTEAVGDELDSSELAAKYQKNLFYNESVPPFWVNLQDMSATELERFREQWQQKQSGFLNTRKPAFTNAPKMDLIKLAETGREMEFVESRKFLRDVFIQHWGIPPELFGILENSNRATIDSAYYLFAKNVINTRKSFYERVITKQLLQKDFDKALVFRIDFKVPKDEVFSLNVTTQGYNMGILSAADWKRENGFQILPGDDKKFFNQALPEEQPKEEDTETETEPEKEYFVFEKKQLSDYQKNHWSNFDQKALSGESQFKQRVKIFAGVQKNRVLDAIGDKTDKKEVLAALDKAFIGADEALKRALAPAWLASMEDGKDLAENTLKNLKAFKQVGSSFGTYNANFDVWIKKFGLEKSKNMNETTYQELKEKLSEGIDERLAEGASIPDIKKFIEESCEGVYDNMSKSRAEAIARTETASSVNFGQQVTYQAEGVEKKQWIAMIDDVTREEHADINMQIVDIEDSFEVGDEELQYPGDPDGSAGNIINCRCTILPVI